MPARFRPSPTCWSAAIRIPLRPRHVLLIGLGGLAIAWVSVLVVDVADVFGWGSTYRDRHRGAPLWMDIFRNNAPVEWLQWSLLGASAAFAAMACAEERLTGRVRLVRLFGLLALGAMLMLINDAGQPRHSFSAWALRMAGVADIHHSPWRLVTEGLVYGALALPMVIALRDLPALRGSGSALRLIVGAYVAYAVAALGSWSSNLGDWYLVVGDRLLAGPLSWLPRMQDRPGFWLFDRLVEESIELVGATLLCAGVLAFLVGRSHPQTVGPTTDEARVR